MKSMSQMKSLLVYWTMSAVIAICLTPGLRNITARGAAPQPAILAQDAPLAVPGSADAAPPAADDDGDYQAGQAQGQPQNDPDSAEQPPTNMQQPPADDSGGDDTSAQPQSGDDNGDQGAVPAAPSTGSEEN